MVRAVTYILLTFCILCSCNSTVKDIRRYQLHGNVERIEVNGESVALQSIHFSTEGMLDSIITYIPQDTLRRIYVYNSKGLLSEIQIKHTDGKYEALHEYEYKAKTVSSYAFRGVDMQVLYRWDYDIESGRQIRCRCYNEGVLISTSEYTYEGLNKIEQVYSPELELVGETTYRYAAPGQISTISSNGFEIQIEYGDDNLPSRSTNAIIGHDGDIFTNADSHLYGTIYYEYIKDRLGNWTERTELLGEEKVKGNTIRRNIFYR